jgi:hypothetical protein
MSRPAAARARPLVPGAQHQPPLKGAWRWQAHTASLAQACHPPGCCQQRCCCSCCARRRRRAAPRPPRPPGSRA